MTRPAHSPNQSTRQSREHHPIPLEPEIVSGSWLVKALLGTSIAAGAALYLTVCLLFYQGQWQFVLAPPKLSAPINVSQVAARSTLPIADVKFGYTEQGVALLYGWYIPALKAAGQRIVLFCPDGRTTLRDNIAALQSFHQLGTAVFAFDYRGFGQSQSGHPSQQKAYADGVAALRYLTDTRHIDPKHIVLYGTGVGTAVAVHIAQHSPGVGGIVLENPQPSFAKQVKREQHIHVLPLWLIFPDRFDITSAISSLKMPKLFIVTSNDAGAAALYREATPPKQRVVIPVNSNATLYAKQVWQQTMQGFMRR